MASANTSRMMVECRLGVNLSNAKRLELLFLAAPQGSKFPEKKDVQIFPENMLVEIGKAEREVRITTSGQTFLCTVTEENLLRECCNNGCFIRAHSLDGVRIDANLFFDLEWVHSKRFWPELDNHISTTQSGRTENAIKHFQPNDHPESTVKKALKELEDLGVGDLDENAVKKKPRGSKDSGYSGSNRNTEELVPPNHDTPPSSDEDTRDIYSAGSNGVPDQALTMD